MVRQDSCRHRVHARLAAVHVVRGAGEAEQSQAGDVRGGIADAGHHAALAGVPLQPRHEEEQGVRVSGVF